MEPLRYDMLVMVYYVQRPSMHSPYTYVPVVPMLPDTRHVMHAG